MAVAIAVLATALPWGPIMAFLVSSPLMSPSDFVLYAGLLGLQFAVAMTVASLAMGLAAGYISHWLEENTHYFDGEIRFDGSPASCSLAAAAASPEAEGAT